MKKLFTLSLLTLALTGCNNERVFTTPANSAPTLSGTLSIDAKALESKTFVLDLQDAQGDIITASIANQSDWITLSTTNNQATITVVPSLFEVGNFQFTVELSDGLLKSEYILTVNVAENREKWQPITLSQEQVLGNWSSDDDSLQVTFATSERGILIHDDKISEFNWSQPDVIELSSYALNCVVQCSQLNLYEIDVLAQRDNKIRVEFHNTKNEESTVLTLTKQDLTQLLPTRYVSTKPRSQYIVSHLTDKQAISYFDVNINYLFTSHKEVNGAENFSFSGHFIENVLTLNGEAQQAGRYSFDLINTAGDEIQAQFDLIVNESEIVAQNNHHLVMKLSHQFEFSDPQVKQTIPNSDELTRTLSTKDTLITLNKINHVLVPELTTGQTYTSRLLPNYNDSNDDTHLRRFPTHFTLTGANSADVIYKDLKTNTTQSKAIMVNNTTEALEFSYAEQQSTARFYKQLDGQLLLVHDASDDRVQFGYPFLPVINPSELTLTDYQHLFTYERSVFAAQYGDLYWFIDDEGQGNHFTYADAGLSDSSSLVRNAFWHLEDDASISFAPKLYCTGASNFTSCKAAILASTDATYALAIFNYRMLHKNNDTYLFDRTTWRRAYDETEGVHKETVSQNIYYMYK